MTAAARRGVIERAATEVFAERGYQGASIDEIARRSGVTAPVVYDHFTSKLDLHKCLLECHFAELRAVWREHFPGDGSIEQRLARAFDAWFAYVHAHPYAWSMLFRDTTADPEVEAVRREVADQSRAELLPLMAQEPRIQDALSLADQEAIELGWETCRSVLQGLALWWYDHPHVPRERVVTAAMNALWIGLERAVTGETWQA
jgi:AcrR family transcriptional regulator